MAISATGEGLTKTMEKHLDEIVKVLQQSMNDPVSFDGDPIPPPPSMFP